MILFESEISYKLKQKKKYKQWLTAIASGEKKKVGDICYLFCDDEYLLSVNQTYLQHDTYTDIITFDYTEGNIVSGDIFISIDRVKENASIFNVQFEEELLRVLAHGVLHLCGYKDKTKKEEAEMRAKENEAILLFAKINEDIINDKK